MAKTHGKTGTRIHRIWKNIKQRCLNPNNPAHHNYMGRGIGLCERWMVFENFYEDVGDPPEADSSLERKDNDGDYEPGNVIWIPLGQQMRNQRRNRLITFSGKTLLLIDWAKALRVSPGSLHRRLELWPIEKALTTPGRS